MVAQVTVVAVAVVVVVVVVVMVVNDTQMQRVHRLQRRRRCLSPPAAQRGCCCCSSSSNGQSRAFQSMNTPVLSLFPPKLPLRPPTMAAEHSVVLIYFPSLQSEELAKSQFIFVQPAPSTTLQLLFLGGGSFGHRSSRANRASAHKCAGNLRHIRHIGEIGL